MCPTMEKGELESGRNSVNKSADVIRRSRRISFETALDLTKFGKFNYTIIIITGLCLNAVLMECLGISFVLPVAQCDLKLTTQDKGILSAVAFAGVISSSHLWGFLADTQGRKKVMQPTMFIAFIITCLSTLTNNFWLFVVLRYLSGFFISGCSATVYAYLGEFHNNRNRSRAIMCASVIFGLFCILLPGIAWLVINQDWHFYIPIIDIVFKPWRLFLVVCGLPGLVSSIAFFFLPESPKFVLGQGNQDKTISILQKVNRWNNHDAQPIEITEIYEEWESIENRRKKLENSKSSFSLLKSMWSQTAPLFMASHLKTTFLACFIQFNIFVTSNGMYMWFPDILNRIAANVNENPGEKISLCNILYMTRLNVSAIDNVSMNESDAHCITKLELSTYEHSIILEMLYAIGFALIGAIINSVGKLIILFVILVVCGLAGIATVLVDIPLLAIYFYVILLCCGLGVSVVNAATIELYPTNLRAMAVCISLMMGRLGSCVGANLVGFLLDYHCEAAFHLCGASLILCGFMAFLIPTTTVKTIDPRFLEPRVSISSRIQ